MKIMMYYKALQLATKLHKGQFRKHFYGEEPSPSVSHPIRVSSLVSGEKLKTIALLHDIIEDTEADEISLLPYGEDVYKAVVALTHRDGESYDDYIRKVKESPMAVEVKIADIADNLMDHPTEHAIKKYIKALNQLIN